MLLTITTSHQPATDLGYLLQKRPSRAQSFALGFGHARVFFPEAGQDLCTAALLLDIDAIHLKRRRSLRSGADFALDQYLNDRPYVASSFLSVAIARVFGSALRGTCKERPDLAETAIPLQAKINVMASRAGRGRHGTTQGGEEMIRALFEPLGYQVETVPHKLDERFPEWGDSVYFTVGLQATTRLQDLLSHLYVLVPVLDDEKHYFVGEEEVEKLLARGGDWLASHPSREAIVDGYLKHQRDLTEDALLRLSEDPIRPTAETDADEESVEKELRLHEQRLQALMDQLEQCGAERVVDMGCGPGRLLKAMMERPQFTEIVGLDVSHRALERAAKFLGVERASARQRKRLKLIQGSLTYRDRRIEGCDAAVLAEVIEHVDPQRLPTVERVLFEFSRPGTLLLTTPNRDYNVSWPSLPAGDRRHPDHRFEWSRREFRTWSEQVAERFGYRVRFHPIGPEDGSVGAPTQMAVFTLADS